MRCKHAGSLPLINAKKYEDAESDKAHSRTHGWPKKETLRSSRAPHSAAGRMLIPKLAISRQDCQPSSFPIVNDAVAPFTAGRRHTEVATAWRYFLAPFSKPFGGNRGHFSRPRRDLSDRSGTGPPPSRMCEVLHTTCPCREPQLDGPTTAVVLSMLRSESLLEADPCGRVPRRRPKCRRKAIGPSV